MTAPGYVELSWRLLSVRARLQFRGFAKVAEPSLQASADQPWEHAQPTVVRLRRLARWLPGSTCLHRSLALIEAARIRGLSARLVMGVQRYGGVSRAHSWVQMGAQNLGETQRDGQPYAPLPSPEIKR